MGRGACHRFDLVRRPITPQTHAALNSRWQSPTAGSTSVPIANFRPGSDPTTEISVKRARPCRGSAGRAAPNAWGFWCSGKSMSRGAERLGTSSSYRSVGDTKGMRTTDFTEDTDEEQTQISGADSFRHWGGCKAMGRIQSNLPVFMRFFISGIGVIRGHSPLFLVAAERSETALLFRGSKTGPPKNAGGTTKGAKNTQQNQDGTEDSPTRHSR